jgi:hypothetical protein
MPPIDTRLLAALNPRVQKSTDISTYPDDKQIPRATSFKLYLSDLVSWTGELFWFHVKKEYADIPTLLNFGEFQRNEGMGQMMIRSQATWSINIVSYQEYWLRFVCWNSEKFKALYDDNYILWYHSVHLLSTLHPTHLDGTLLTGPEPHTLIVFGNRRINNPSCAPSHIFVTKEIISPAECILPQH